MFAVIKTGGKQYKVAKDDIITIEKLIADEGKSVTFDEVLLVGDKVGSPTVKGAAVTAKVLKQTRGEKVVIFKKKRRHNYRRKKGHRQDLTLVQITKIAESGGAKAAPAAKAEAPAEKKAAPAKAAAPKAAAKKAPAKKAPAKKPAAKKE